MSTQHSVKTQAPGPWRLGYDLHPSPVQELSLYVHIPFCECRCRYCNFYFETGWSERVLQRTLDTILEESRQWQSLLFATCQPSIRSVYFGGGTPSVIPADILDQFLTSFNSIWQLDSLNSHVCDSFEAAFESNPESLDYDKLSVLSRHGFNRLSLGVQTFDDQQLRILGRKARQADIERCLTMLAHARCDQTWTGKVNIDLMCGLPGQSDASLLRDLKKIVDFGPDHVSLYTLTVEERTPLEALLKTKSEQALDDDTVEALWFLADGFLEEHGLLNYEVSNYARPGCESQHNLAYWQLAPYIGLGPGAVGTLDCQLALADGSKQFASMRLTNPSAFAYSRPGRRHWEHQTELIAPSDFFLEHFITGLRTSSGFDLARAARRCGMNEPYVKNALAPWIASLQERSLLQSNQTKLSLNKAGRLILNVLLEELLDLKLFKKTQQGTIGQK